MEPKNQLAWNVVDCTNPTCNIYTYLLNGFLDDRGVKPTEGAAGAIYYTDKNVANTKFYYPAFGPMQPDHTMPENANGIYYAEEGVDSYSIRQESPTILIFGTMVLK